MHQFTSYCGDQGSFTPVLRYRRGGHFDCLLWRVSNVPPDLAQLHSARSAYLPLPRIYRVVLRSTCDGRVHAGKATHADWKCLAGFPTKKSGGTLLALHREQSMANSLPWWRSMYQNSVTCKFHHVTGIFTDHITGNTHHKMVKHTCYLFHLSPPGHITLWRHKKISNM